MIIKKVWVRVLISLFGGGFVMELLHISTGDPNRPMTSNFSFLFGLIIYAVLTAIVKIRQFTNNKSQKPGDPNILDSDLD